MFSTAASSVPDVVMDMSAMPFEADMAKHKTKEGFAVMRSRREVDEYSARTGKKFDRDAVMGQPYMRGLTAKEKRILDRSVGK